MAENSEDKITDWQALYDYERHRAPVRELSPSVDRNFEWLASNRLHKIPNDWLKHYARCFHFSDEEIWAARTTRDMPRASGIYFFFVGDECIYVGQTKNFADRSLQHERNGMLWTSHTYFEVPKFFAPDVEAYYIRRLRPPLNASCPPSPFYSSVVNKLGLDCRA